MGAFICFLLTLAFTAISLMVVAMGITFFFTLAIKAVTYLFKK
ncbi:hypothetical protein [Clostridium felsineum]|nr:hypothetical protein [Clostridium felsineum]